MFSWTLGLLLALLCLRPGDGQPQEVPPFRFAFSMGLLRQYSENDARAAMRVWVETLARERRVSADPNVKVFDGYRAVETALRERAVDGLTLPTDQLWALGSSNYFNRALFPSLSGSLTHEYVLLVNVQSSLTNLSNLRGRSLAVYAHSVMSLARPWLDTLLLQSGLPASAQLFARTTTLAKPTQVVLPVFFQQTDACLLDRHTFGLMAELNPQVGKQLRVLAGSMPLVPIGFYFRSGYPEPSQGSMIAELARLHATPAGQQVLTIFQTDRLVERPLSYVARSLELLEEHKRLTHKTNEELSISALRPAAENAEGGK